MDSDDKAAIISLCRGQTAKRELRLHITYNFRRGAGPHFDAE
jgi:hypothetical protein